MTDDTQPAHNCEWMNERTGETTIQGSRRRLSSQNLTEGTLLGET